MLICRKTVIQSSIIIQSARASNRETSVPSTLMLFAKTWCHSMLSMTLGRTWMALHISLMTAWPAFTTFFHPCGAWQRTVESHPSNGSVLRRSPLDAAGARSNVISDFNATAWPGSPVGAQTTSSMNHDKISTPRSWYRLKAMSASDRGSTKNYSILTAILWKAIQQRTSVSAMTLLFSLQIS